MNILGKDFYAPRGFALRGALPHTDDMTISDLRKTRGLTQVDLAEMARLTQPTVSRAENLDDGATLGTYKAIAVALGVPLGDLFGDARTRDEQNLLEAFRRLPPERQRGWLDMAALAAADQS